MSKAEDDYIATVLERAAGIGAPTPAAVLLPGAQVALVLQAVDASIELHERQAQTKVFSDRQRCFGVLAELRRARKVLAR